MSGHSKWANIKHKKEKTDKAKAKIFTKIGKELTIAVKEGGPDPASNAKLRDRCIRILMELGECDRETATALIDKHEDIRKSLEELRAQA